MHTKTHTPNEQYVTTVEVLERGWHVLVEHLGIGDTTRFIRSYYRGYGDSVKEIREFWGNKSRTFLRGLIPRRKVRDLLLRDFTGAIPV